ncbi:hypothetical protein AMES_7205 [Amycolatopsis mediterranei S699]|uniref:Cobalamin-independent methionine synthase MetE C-terminal/archaeal domain-containing protein n=1 Tax=Amycolatopsis mediterranei (strain U-32) TaxID=749927 RepID=A0A0H3DEA1_AMYMU|nr:conserved hypothetical protein [Amycolatopsis mediterranei U32]AFO80738.1 hypothetical protein AMES_7205 [Amycolatopsis mediterranei S699]AGT87866.1 hypothetical protein B737_7205 [Amycolatopsis mediterranei RB]KDU93848.1 hypothetical protein DV36_00475 [Amycolatopsis mediterranei]
MVLGLVSTKTTRVESVDEIIGRLKDATAHIPAEQLALSTQCGFASMVDAHPDLTEDVQAAKLDLVAEAATAFWKA